MYKNKTIRDHFLAVHDVAAAEPPPRGRRDPRHPQPDRVRGPLLLPRQARRDAGEQTSCRWQWITVFKVANCIQSFKHYSKLQAVFKVSSCLQIFKIYSNLQIGFKFPNCIQISKLRIQISDMSVYKLSNCIKKYPLWLYSWGLIRKHLNNKIYPYNLSDGHVSLFSLRSVINCITVYEA